MGLKFLLGEAIPCLESVNVANRQRSEGWRVIILETETRPNPWALLSGWWSRVHINGMCAECVRRD